MIHEEVYSWIMKNEIFRNQQMQDPVLRYAIYSGLSPIEIIYHLSRYIEQQREIMEQMGHENGIVPTSPRMTWLDDRQKVIFPPKV